ncbi:MAG: IS5 family transposase, partial [Acidobacteriaceae bacterium]
REFARLDAGITRLPDESTILRFRHLLEAHDLGTQILATVNAVLAQRGLLLKTGTVVDATLIAAPSSTKNSTGTRDPEMHSTKKGNQWHFGMKAHIGADADSGLVHSLHTTPAHQSDVAHTAELLHGEETQVFADAGYTGAPQRAEVVQAQTQGRMRPDVDWQIAQRRSTVNKLPQGPHKTLIQALERAKARVRAR